MTLTAGYVNHHVTPASLALPIPQSSRLSLRRITLLSEDDITNVANALKSYDAGVENKTWRDLAIVAISAMSHRFAEPTAVEPDLEPLVAKLHKQFKPATFSDDRALDRICSLILGDEGYANWLATSKHQQHD